MEVDLSSFCKTSRILIVLLLTISTQTQVSSGEDSKLTDNVNGGTGNAPRSPKILSLFQNLLRLPVMMPQNQYYYKENSPSSQQLPNLYNQQQQQLFVQQQPYQKQQNYYEYELNGQTHSGIADSASTNSDIHESVLNVPTQNQLSGNVLPKFAFGDITDLSSLTNLLSFGSMEGVVDRVNRFDKLKCIPKIMCQMIAKRQEDAERDRTSTTTARTTTTKRPVSRDSNKTKKQRDSNDARFIKIQGVDTALEQVVKFLDVMQLKDWSFYPYLQGAYEGHQVKRSDDCLQKYSTCPFSDDQLVYYFNNYNGGLFQSFRSLRKYDAA